MNESIVLILLGVAGVAFGCLRKMGRLKGDADSINVDFGWKMYLKKDYIAIIVSLLSVGIWYWIFGEWAQKYPWLVDFKRTMFVFAGYGGAELIQDGFDKFSKSAKKYIRAFGDVKSNISDIKAEIAPTDSIETVIEKGNLATGVDVTIAPPAPKETPDAEADGEKV